METKKKYAAEKNVTPSKEVTVVTPGRPERVYAIGNVRARIWKNDSPVGIEWRIETVYVYSVSNRGHGPKWGTTKSIPLHAVPDAARAMKKAYRWVKRQRISERWLAVMLLRW